MVELEGLTGMEFAVVGVTGGEVFAVVARWT
jgi:hypothetical protein